jgi:glycerol-3-phosphate dehydrogenase subunit C
MPAVRGVMHSVLGVHKERELPPYAPKKFRSSFKPSTAFPVRDGSNTPGKVAIFSTCYVNYNEPGMGHDLLAILEHNEIPYVLVESEACCGMPKFELGDLKGVDALKQKNMPVLARYARDGYAILAPVPSCALMFKQELPLMYPDDADAAAVSDAMWDPFEYFVQRKKDGLFRTDFRQPLGKVSYHIPCHSRVQNMGQKTRELLEAVPGTEVKTVERCSGHDGTWGVKTEYFENSMKIGRPVFRQMAEPGPDYVSSDCPIAARHIRQGMGEEAKNAEKAHPRVRNLGGLRLRKMGSVPVFCIRPFRVRGADAGARGCPGGVRGAGRCALYRCGGRPPRRGGRAHQRRAARLRRAPG